MVHIKHNSIRDAFCSTPNTNLSQFRLAKAQRIGVGIIRSHAPHKIIVGVLIVIAVGHHIDELRYSSLKSLIVWFVLFVCVVPFVSVFH